MALDAAHMNVTSNRSYNNEDALQSAVYLAYIYALNEYTAVREMTAGRGFADVVYIPFKDDVPAMIVELKQNRSAGSALKQIREKNILKVSDTIRGTFSLSASIMTRPPRFIPAGLRNSQNPSHPVHEPDEHSVSRQVLHTLGTQIFIIAAF